MRFLILIAFWLSACANIPQELNPKVYYRHDMTITVNGKVMDGIGVAPYADKYEIAIYSKADMDLLQITSCQRDITVESAIKSGWLRPRRAYLFTYAPTSIEREPGCILKMAGYEKVNGRHSWAFIDFEDQKYTLPAGVACNGAPEYRSEGVSACQSLQGLIQMIWFQNRVVLSDKVLERCKLPESQDGGVHWKFKAQNRECIYQFMEVKAPYRRHRLTVVGYEDVPVRGQ